MGRPLPSSGAELGAIAHTGKLAAADVVDAVVGAEIGVGIAVGRPAGIAEADPAAVGGVHEARTVELADDRTVAAADTGKDPADIRAVDVIGETAANPVGGGCEE